MFILTGSKATAGPHNLELKYRSKEWYLESASFPDIVHLIGKLPKGSGSSLIRVCSGWECWCSTYRPLQHLSDYDAYQLLEVNLLVSALTGGGVVLALGLGYSRLMI
ncbi:uncharacterized protein BT62DRAFT_924311 [Guyanagaster necrorhizus]|uniref:Uncharacterized protein n=1 Tax=Guyanagaster necrorhizus TaxID=856835 RepID=A0A9P8ALP5_9AGAR|nr:uncharacterized protein BT62DRAFT_924311 [Guyanagaster necrorhizus MCA 3950]KAG7440015.1 hypothetical protein BT62DRAFT_924311 [Guyanagaster necrorhizus MCA 3950]